MWNNYSTVDISNITENGERMKTQLPPLLLIESFYKQLEKGKDFTQQGNETISKSQLVRYVYANILTTGLFAMIIPSGERNP